MKCKLNMFPYIKQTNSIKVKKKPRNILFRLWKWWNTILLSVKEWLFSFEQRRIWLLHFHVSSLCMTALTALLVWDRTIYVIDPQGNWKIITCLNYIKQFLETFDFLISLQFTLLSTSLSDAVHASVICPVNRKFINHMWLTGMQTFNGIGKLDVFLVRNYPWY